MKCSVRIYGKAGEVLFSIRKIFSQFVKNGWINKRKNGFIEVFPRVFLKRGHLHNRKTSRIENIIGFPPNLFSILRCMYASTCLIQTSYGKLVPLAP